MTKLYEVFLIFTKLGFTAFGGPAAHIAMMRQEIVVKRAWITDEYFLDPLGATNLIPGPNSTELAIHLGYIRAGWKGLLIAGLCFITPAILITGLLAMLYAKYGNLPDVQPFVYGIQPAVISLIIAAVFPLAQKSLKSPLLIFIAITVLILSLAGNNELTLMAGAGVFAVIAKMIRSRASGSFLLVPLSAFKVLSVFSLSTVNTGLFWIFLKIGAVLYGSGYVLFAFLDTELVGSGMLSRTELIDAVAVGQFTPGPVFSAVTFVGYLINGWSGAAVATFAIFLPSFIFVALLSMIMKKLKRSELFRVSLDAVNVAAVAVILAVCVNMSREVITSWQTILIALTSVATLFAFPRLNSFFVVAGGALLGYLLSLF